MSDTSIGDIYEKKKRKLSKGKKIRSAPKTPSKRKTNYRSNEKKFKNG